MQFESGSSSKTLKGGVLRENIIKFNMGLFGGVKADHAGLPWARSVVSISVRRVYKCLYSAEAETER